jgi:hypothetical protein
MGVPRFRPQDVPFVGGTGAPEETLDVNGIAVRVSVLSMGNPHAVQRVASIDAAPVASQGPVIEHHTRFPNRVNAGYMEIVDRVTIRLRVWERGAGETLACGTGACAASGGGRPARTSRLDRARDRARWRASRRVAGRGCAGDDDGTGNGLRGRYGRGSVAADISGKNAWTHRLSPST